MKKLFEIFARVLKVEVSEINMDTTAENLVEWDSMNHLVLMTEIQKAFKVDFSTDEINELDSVKKIIKKIKEKNG